MTDIASTLYMAKRRCDSRRVWLFYLLSVCDRRLHLVLSHQRACFVTAMKHSSTLRVSALSVSGSCVIILVGPGRTTIKLAMRVIQSKRDKSQQEISSYLGQLTEPNLSR